MVEEKNKGKGKKNSDNCWWNSADCSWFYCDSALAR